MGAGDVDQARAPRHAQTLMHIAAVTDQLIRTLYLRQTSPLTATCPWASLCPPGPRRPPPTAGWSRAATTWATPPAGDAGSTFGLHHRGSGGKITNIFARSRSSGATVPRRHLPFRGKKLPTSGSVSGKPLLEKVAPHGFLLGRMAKLLSVKHSLSVAFDAAGLCLLRVPSPAYAPSFFSSSRW